MKNIKSDKIRFYLKLLHINYMTDSQDSMTHTLCKRYGPYVANGMNDFIWSE